MQNELKALLILIPLMGEGNEKGKVSDGYKALVDKFIHKVVGRLKVLGYPGDPEVIA